MQPMSKRPQWLLDHASNKYSQTGEDGVIAKVLSLLPKADQWCVEFGAWDGIHLSNVRNLLLEKGFHGVLIEGDAEKFQELERNYAGNDRVRPINAFVGFDSVSGLDGILSSTDIPQDFDFLSIDIDGNDYHVWESITKYRPKVVCVEFNHTIPSEVDFVQPADPRIQQGSSLTALDRLAGTKGYELVCVLPWNGVWVDQKYFAAFEIADNRPQVMRTDYSTVTWLFSGYDGSVHLAGARRMPWHDIAMDERQHQALPRLLRTYPGNYTTLERWLFGALKKLGMLRV